MAKQEWDVDKSLKRFLELDMEVLALCKANGLGKRWMKRGQKIITKLGFVPTNPSDFRALNKRRVAKQARRVETKSSNAEDDHRHEGTRIRHGHRPHDRRYAWFEVNEHGSGAAGDDDTWRRGGVRGMRGDINIGVHGDGELRRGVAVSGDGRKADLGWD